ncbi:MULTISPECIES: AbrB/MazE/SpoVT family DNA-binding domain-containing protein [unclassified Ruminococcus]|uniref:AbrB/MazE/SpoVT family DNA-binding domain-containing protein n=1 Tax=unclassified Ruminococcus TaxID=2608920 RepID=UPI00210A45BD|nr:MULTISPECIES: AbrB/MazE/SpoVT family DNA-binding domain-containing protein [unclassified Ruminococcus]
MTIEQRKIIANMLCEGASARMISEQIVCHIASVYREIERGKNENGVYDPYYAEKVRKENKLIGKPTPLMLTEKDLAQEIADFLIAGEGSVNDAITVMRNRGHSNVPSKNTLYSSIDKGLIPGVSRETLHRNQTRMYNNGQVHIPKWMRDMLSLADGEELSIKLKNGKIIIEKSVDEGLRLNG